MSAFSGDSLQLVSASLDPQGHQQYRQGSCGLYWETEDTSLLISGVQQSLLVLMPITVKNTGQIMWRKVARIFLGDWTHKLQCWGQGRQAWCDKEQRSCSSPAEILWSAPLSGTKDTQRAAGRSWIGRRLHATPIEFERGVHRPQGGSLSCVSLKRRGFWSALGFYSRREQCNHWTLSAT